jgi:hypothetical protein
MLTKAIVRRESRSGDILRILVSFPRDTPRRPGSDGVNNALVLRERRRHPAAGPQLEAPIGLEASMKLLRLFRQKGVLAGFVDDVVEALVGVVVGIRVLLRCLPNAIFVRLLELSLQGLGDPPGTNAPHMPSSAAITSNRTTTS